VASTGKGNPWERLDDEPTAAYEAFKVYRDFGPSRSIDAAGLIISPIEHGAQEGAQKGRKRGATGRIRTYFKVHRWAERAQAYDVHQATLFQKGADEVTVRQGREWAERRDRAYRDLADRWEKRLKQTDVIAAMPLTTQTVERDGKVIVIQPVDVLDHYRAVQMASRIQQRYVEVLDRGLALENKDIEKTASETIPIPATASMTDLASGGPNELDAWRVYQRQQILRMPTEPPDDAPGSPYHGANGSS
jgi:hypothetical protein